MKKKFEKYPRFINNSPCGEDLFEGHSHTIVAERICDVIKNDEGCRIIGIDGGWGTGKSNLIELVKKQLDSDPKYHFFIYDAWGHQNDSQRRSILEELTEDLTSDSNGKKGLLNNKKWHEKLKLLLAKTREVNTKTIPRLSCGFILSALALIVTPILNVITEDIQDTCKKVFIISIPLAVVLAFIIILFVINISKYIKHKRFSFVCKKTLSDTFNFYSNESKENTTFETISEDEPSTRKFRRWMDEINVDLKESKLIIVFDNMDRLPCMDVQELWASIHTFFAEDTYPNIKVIIPFDREHIKAAFKQEDISFEEDNNQQDKRANNQQDKTVWKKHYYGEDFINKTFNAVYRVSPPILSDWKKYFGLKWTEAFGKEIEDSSVTQIYDLLTEDQTPRKIVAFINEFVTVKQLFDESVPDKYIALFILGKDKISKDPYNEILKPTYLGPLSFMYKDDEDLAKYISALYFQLNPEKAIDIVFGEKLKKALDRGDKKTVSYISNISNFYALLENAITSVTNIPNVVMALDSCIGEDLSLKARTIWDCVYKKSGDIEEDSLKEYQSILLQKISDNKNYLKRIINEFAKTEKFSAIAYYSSIRRIEQLPDIDPFSFINQITIDEVSFVEFVKDAKEGYKKYKLVCSKEQLDVYLSTQSAEQLLYIDIIPYIKEEYTLEKYTKHLKESILNAETPVKDCAILYDRLKQIEEPVSTILPDDRIYTYFNSMPNDNPFYFDLICMRMTRLKKYNASYDSIFKNILSNNEESIVKEISKRIESYIKYGDFLMNIKIMADSPLYIAVANEITKNEYTESKVNIFILLQKFDEISEYLDPKSLISSFNRWDVSKSINKDNINKIPISVFELANEVRNDLTNHCVNCMKEYLDGLTIDKWYESIINNSYEYQVSKILNIKVSQNKVEALNKILKDTANGTITDIPDKIRIAELIEKASKDGKGFINIFKNVRDSFCTKTEMTPELFSFYGDWLFKYSKMSEKKESLRRIFTTEILDIPENINLILNNSDKMKKIIDAAAEESDDFKIKIGELVKNDNENPDLIEFAKSIGIEFDYKDNNS